jgi:hypothetical protein
MDNNNNTNDILIAPSIIGIDNPTDYNTPPSGWVMQRILPTLYRVPLSVCQQHQFAVQIYETDYKP